MTNWALWGTLVNTATVLGGALVGLLIKKIASVAARKRKITVQTTDDTGDRARTSTLTSTVMTGLGLCVLLIGLMGAMKVENVLVMIVSVALGSLVGELLDLDGWMKRFGDFVERRMKGRAGSVSEGFVTATLLFCVGAMTVTGAIESGVNRIHTTYYAKALLDMVSATVFASTLGFGVVLSAVSVFVTQGALTLLAVLAAGAIPMAITGEMVAVGSLLVVAIGTNLMGITHVKVMNLLPAMFFPIALCPLFSLLPL